MSERPLSGYIDPNFTNPGKDGDAPIIIYGYTPSLVVGVLGVVIFTLSALIHGWQVFRYRTWWFLPVFIGCLLEIVGYVFRILSSQIDPYFVIYFVVQYFFIVVAPVLFSAACYTILSVLINAHPDGRRVAPLPPKVILWIFIASDIIATGVQVAGAALVGSAYSERRDPTAPNYILLGGLAFQCFSFFIFVVIGGLFLVRMQSVAPKSENRQVTSTTFLLATCVATLAIYLRTVFRLAETAQGLEKSLSTHEVYFGCLEFAPIVVAVTLLNIWHPGRCIRR